MKIGIDSFVAAVPDALTGENLGPTDRLKLLLDEIEFADRVGLDVFGVGEHHRAEFRGEGGSCPSLAVFVGRDLIGSRGQTQQRLGRLPTGPGLTTDLNVKQASHFKSEKVDVTEARTNK